MISSPRRVASSTMICKRSLKMLVRAALHVRLLDSVQLLSLQLAAQSSGCTVYNSTQALFLIVVHENVSITCLQHRQEQLKIFEVCAFAMHGSRKRLSTRSSTDQDLDFLHLADCSWLSCSQSMQLPQLPCVGLLLLLAP